MAPHSSTLAWKIPWTEEPGGLQSMGSLRVRRDWATSLSLSTFMHWRRKWQPTPMFLPGESQGQRSWQEAVYVVAQSWTCLKRLSSSSSSRTGSSSAWIASLKELMLLNCDVGEDSWESLGLQGDPTSPFWRRSAKSAKSLQSCLTLCDPMDWSVPGFPVHHQLPELTQTHVHWVGDTIQPSHPLSSASAPAFNLS